MSMKMNLTLGFEFDVSSEAPQDEELEENHNPEETGENSEQADSDNLPNENHKERKSASKAKRQRPRGGWVL